jgi:hypothetical protein
MKLARKHPFTHTFFVMSDLEERCILGYDFLEVNAISVNPSERSITYIKDNETKKLIIPSSPICSFSLVTPMQFEFLNVSETDRENMKNLLYKYFSLFTENINELGKAKSVQHLIRTTKLPKVLPMRRTPERLRLIVKKQIDEMLKNNVIRPSTSPFASPIGETGAMWDMGL